MYCSGAMYKRLLRTPRRYPKPKMKLQSREAFLSSFYLYLICNCIIVCLKERGLNVKAFSYKMYGAPLARS
jgi:hypothetical protein